MCASRHDGASFSARLRRFRSKTGSVVTLYVNGSSGETEAGSQAAIPKPARLRKVAIIRGLYACRASELSVAYRIELSAIGRPRYPTTLHISAQRVSRRQP